MEEQQQLNSAEQQDPNAETQPAPSAAVTPSAAPGEAELRRQLSQYEAAFTALQPYGEIIEKLVNDPSTAQVVQDSVRAYETIRSQQPEIPEAIKPVYEKVVYLTDKVDGWEKERQKQQQAQEAQQRAEQEAQARTNYAYAERLVAEHPELAEDNYWRITAIGMYANQNSLTLEQAFKRVGSQFVNDKARSAPPSSLRADAGEPGIPAQSKATGTEGAFNFRQMLLDRLKKAQ